MYLPVRCLLVAAIALVAGCDASPVSWTDPVAVDASANARTLVVDTTGRAQFVAPAAEAGTEPAAPNLCRATVRQAVGLALAYSAWWSVRPDSSAGLWMAVSRDSGRTWGIPRAVDTTDVSSAGCTRPPPSVTMVGDDVYVAYSMIAPEGKGVFFAHTMGSMLHAPVPVIYGERLVSTAIAAEGDRVAVAYDEPNGTREQVDVALSSTQGHIFETHTTASRGVDAATEPEIAIAGPYIAISWTTNRDVQGANGSRRRVVRIGRVGAAK